MAKVETKRSWGWLRILKVVAITAAALLLLLITIVGGWLYANRDTITIGAPGATELLQEVVTRARFQALPASTVDYIEADGTTPDTASQTFATSGELAAKMAIVRSCRSLGLGDASADMRTIDPTTLCEGQWNKHTVYVYAKTRCARRCETLLTVEM